MDRKEFDMTLKLYLGKKYPNIPKDVDFDNVSNLNLTVTQLTGLLSKYASDTISAEEKKLFTVLKEDLIKDVASIPASAEELKEYYNEVVRLTDLAESL